MKAAGLMRLNRVLFPTMKKTIIIGILVLVIAFIFSYALRKSLSEERETLKPRLVKQSNKPKSSDRAVLELKVKKPQESGDSKPTSESVAEPGRTRVVSTVEEAEMLYDTTGEYVDTPEDLAYYQQRFTEYAEYTDDQQRNVLLARFSTEKSSVVSDFVVEVFEESAGKNPALAKRALKTIRGIKNPTAIPRLEKVANSTSDIDLKVKIYETIRVMNMPSKSEFNRAQKTKVPMSMPEY